MNDLIKKLPILLLILYTQTIVCQTDTIQKIEEVYINSYRLKIPFAQTSHTVTVLDSLWISQQKTLSLEQILQNINGVDIRRRGIEGMQSDVYIRGGGYEQVLILIDGIKMDDLQTGHHIMNTLLNPENIERIEVIKGAASRIYGQNAMNGAINFVTKKTNDNRVKATLKSGSFGTYGAGFQFEKNDNQNVLFSIDHLQSNGYRYNTDFEYWNAFSKTEINNFTILATYSDRQFGANGFYKSPLYTEQYEETQTHLLAVKRQWNLKDWQATAQTYWRRNKDMYLFLRNNPSFYRNMHLNNKLTLSFDANHYNDKGQTGLGVEVTQGLLRSNNLGHHNRFSTSMFAEQKLMFLQSKLDVTPGVSVTFHDDLGWFVYPGIDVGYRWHQNLKFYFNSGYTSRVPTYTNLYITSSSEAGNPNLKPEKAFAAELGYHFITKKIQWQSVYFMRKTTDLIDWVKFPTDTQWNAQNLNKVNTKGVETHLKYQFKVFAKHNFLNIGYTYMDEEIEKEANITSLYQINHFKHQLTSGLQIPMFKNTNISLQYRYSNRVEGNDYHIFDSGLSSKFKQWQVNLQFNNLFDTIYTETNLVPMPQFNMMCSVGYQFK